MSKYILVNPETLKESIEMAESGDTIVLDDSEYIIPETLVIPDGIKLTTIYGIKRGRKDG